MPANDLALLLAAARSAGKVALKYFHDGAESWEKPDNQGLVTEADLAVDAHLLARLRDARPDYGWLSEETQDDRARLDAPRTFVIDPIDGTRAFAERYRSWAISVAVVEAGRPVAAVIHLPARRLTYTAALGQGAVLNAEVLLHVTGRTELPGASLLASRPTMEPEHWPRGLPPVRREFRTSLAYRMALVAEGRFDAMATFRDTWDWDIAAGSLIAAEAGATVTDAEGAALSFNSTLRHSPGLICATPAIHEALLSHRR